MLAVFSFRRSSACAGYLLPGCQMKYSIAEIGFDVSLDSHDNIPANGNDLSPTIENNISNVPWRDEHIKTVRTVQLHSADRLPPVGGNLIWDGDTCTVKKSADTEIRIYHDPVLRRPYAIYSQDAAHGIHVLCRRDWLEQYCRTVYLFNVFALEKQLIQYGRIVFHSCYIRTGGVGLLFSGDSGAGKSTQGSLWEKYMQAEVINGDRSVLGQRDGEWTVYGFPFCGTSGISRNVTCPLNGIVFVRQAKENSIRKLDPAQAQMMIWQQCTVNQWDIEFVDASLELTAKLAESLPVYELSCKPDEGAVLCVKEALGL